MFCYCYDIRLVTIKVCWFLVLYRTLFKKILYRTLKKIIEGLTKELNKCKEKPNIPNRSTKSNISSFNTTSKNITQKTRNNQFLTNAKKNNVKSKAKKNVFIPRLDFSKLPQKNQAVFKVIQCEQSSTSSVDDVIKYNDNTINVDSAIDNSITSH